MLSVYHFTHMPAHLTVQTQSPDFCLHIQEMRFPRCGKGGDKRFSTRKNSCCTCWWYVPLGVGFSTDVLKTREKRLFKFREENIRFREISGEFEANTKIGSLLR